jgi:putative ubiquitin-RnfH superfamily antitoxin RatB of RatAB toxin-antitoxin module
MARVEATSGAPAGIEVEVVHSPKGGPADCTPLALPPGATLADAVLASGVAERHGLDVATLVTGVWGRVQPPTHILRDGDRVEIYRPLVVDPKTARRLRFQKERRAKGGAASPGAALSGSRTR